MVAPALMIVPFMAWRMYDHWERFCSCILLADFIGYFLVRLPTDAGTSGAYDFAILAKSDRGFLRVTRQ